VYIKLRTRPAVSCDKCSVIEGLRPRRDECVSKIEVPRWTDGCHHVATMDQLFLDYVALDYQLKGRRKAAATARKADYLGLQ
jgi:hypothetical protein